jgi:hypothetical protein
MTRAQEISKQAAIVHRALKRYERNYILSGKFDKAQEMAAMSKGIANVNSSGGLGTNPSQPSFPLCL